MPGPSDIRVNPFNNATNYVNLTERHIVPSVSPFVVRLNEVPEKQDPSNMQMYYVDDTTGQTTETALTEVAATPGAGEFRPDYSTNAFDDTSWNTGLIEFSSADAGKIIEVSYTATGTLAGVKTNRYPAWWLDRGDGSDGDFIPESNVTIDSSKQYNNVFIKEGITVTVNAFCKICATGGFYNAGIINANGKGASGGSGNISPTAGHSGNTIGNGGAGGSGAAGGNGKIYNDKTTSEDNIVFLILHSLNGDAIGAGGGGGAGYDGGGGNRRYGGSGGSGGGNITIVCKEFKNVGIIRANGNNGGQGTGDRSNGGGGGGGAGGAIIVLADSISDEGTCTVDGGSGGSGTPAGASGDAGIVLKINIGD